MNEILPVILVIALCAFVLGAVANWRLDNLERRKP